MRAIVTLLLAIFLVSTFLPQTFRLRASDTEKKPEPENNFTSSHLVTGRDGGASGFSGSLGARDAMLNAFADFSANMTGLQPQSSLGSAFSGLGIGGSIVANYTNIRVNQDTSFQNQNEPSVAVNPTNTSNIIVGMHDFTVYPSIVVAYVSNDGGNTWTGPIPVPMVNPSDFGSDPVVGFNSSGVAFFAYMSIHYPTTDIVVSRSLDGGLTWNGPVKAAQGISFVSVLDKPWMAIGPDPIVPSQDNIYVTYTNFSYYGADMRIELARSLDGGLSFQPPIPISPRVTFPQVVQGSIPAVAPSGTVYVAYYDSTPDGWLVGDFQPRVKSSTDGGASFSGPYTIATGREVPYILWPTAFRAWATMFPIITVGPEGNLYAVFASNPAGADTSDILFAASFNSGVNWTTPARVNDDLYEQDQFYPSIHVQSDGTIHIIYGDRRNDPYDRRYDLYDTSSSDNGTSFQFSLRATDNSSDPSFNSFIGDYFDLDVTNNFTFAVWTDERNLSTFGEDIFLGRGLKAPAIRVHNPGVPLAVQEPDTCAEAYDLGIGGFVSGDTGYSDNDYETLYGNGRYSPDSVFKITSTQTGTLVISISGFFPALSIRSVCTDVTSQIAESYGALVLPNFPPGTYYVILDGSYSPYNFGPYTLSAVFLPPPQISLNPAAGLPGAIVTVTGQGFLPFGFVYLTFAGTQIGSTYVDSNGNFKHTFTVPFLAPGSYAVIATDPYFTASASFAIIDTTPLTLTMPSGSVFARGQTANFYFEAAFKGVRAPADILLFRVYDPRGILYANLANNVTSLGVGLYRLSFRIPSNASPGNYAILVEARYTTIIVRSDGTTLGSFQVSGSVATFPQGLAFFGVTAAVVSFAVGTRRIVGDRRSR